MSKATATIRRSCSKPAATITMFYPGFIWDDTKEYRLPSNYDPCDPTSPSIIAFVKKRFGKRTFAPRPFGYQTSVVKRGGKKWISGMVYLSGTIRKAKEVLAGTDPNEEILRTNIRRNKTPAVVTILGHSYPLTKADKVLTDFEWPTGEVK